MHEGVGVIPAKAGIQSDGAVWVLGRVRDDVRRVHGQVKEATWDGRLSYRPSMDVGPGRPSLAAAPVIQAP